MAERFFPGFEFKTFELPNPIEVVVVGRRLKPTTPIETVVLDDLIGLTQEVVLEPEIQAWTPKELKREFKVHLGQIDRQIGYPRLTMRRRTMKFVTQDEMRPKTAQERQSLVQKYGDYIAADGGAGDCTRNPNGTFSIRIGCAGQEDQTAKEAVLHLMGHEYGHTLGSHIDDVVFEELKAYTFANLFMKYYYGVDTYRLYQLDVSTVHDTALFWLEQLLDKGVSEEAILAHLTGKRFDRSHPTDYLK